MLEFWFKEIMSRKRKALDERKKPIVIAYIDCPRPCWCHSTQVVPQAINNALEVGATVINLTFNNEADAKTWTPEIAKTKGLVSFACHSTGAVMSWYSMDDLE